MYKLLFILFLGTTSSAIDAVQQGTIGTITISGTIFVESPCHTIITQEDITVECKNNVSTTYANTYRYSLPKDTAPHFVKDMHAFVTSSKRDENHKVVMITYQ